MNTGSVKNLTCLKNIGPETARTLIALGIQDIDQLRELGPEGIVIELVHNFGFEHPHVHTCFLYAIEGAIHDKSWLDMTEERKEELKYFIQNMKKGEIFSKETRNHESDLKK